ncbi:SDR family NAD(P)-dependent oxidoreductase [Pseudomonas sp. BCA14]|uniref:SDR family NAD(P)-dependent oxidoreductase n=1 Tax=unclassified Pseudomonas TaxID=196821 RepID=UPI00106EA99C|nr:MULTISPECIES: SDR family NAD(P)-dependent oxidoreductase [unclassified Pseudomonas]TFF02914.1 SDR family NAD(P)-dependent oxidoreductase [Pseudomonas sp. JMN1]TFF04317.1 SDR family NAD(P)-dependent oxidoreductase [Pseudomonas sp. BCA17]TFF20109.1 SDR family NAD(P)-dependent oxidoreductase [Pseudomonas sp. BCA14]TFF20368.1 SDR family NAD(P)-dependent oxidoreductase [Pseudomonas sp. BCA13]
MSSQAFQSIIARLQQRQITADEARQLLQQLKAGAQATTETPSATRPKVHDEIAVIGMSGQFPAADNVERFWHNLSTGADGVVELGERYLDAERSYSAERQPGKTYCKWGGVLEQRDDFDPLFFNISPRDAESMNPHQRLILQESWKALEDAGYNPKSFRDQSVGIFVGAEPTGYFHETFIGASDAIIASRLSYFLDFKGPALVVNTGCSSSATAIHLACESLRNGEVDLALAGGVFATLGEPGLISLAQMDMLSPTGHCHTFDQRSDGIVLSEAVGMLTLKRLSQALADGDPIYGVICASGMNQDGASNGITAPSGQAQERLISELYSRFGIDPRQISYVEAHGTGTPLGDPVEVNALARAFRQFTDDTGYCALGSAKAHIGHTSAAAGVVSLIKILLSMKHRQLPGLLNFELLNPRIELAGSAFHIHAEPREWLGSGPKMAALNSFGHSGTNVHMVIREAPEVAAAPVTDEARPCLLPLSARTADSLKRYARRVRQALLDPALRLPDLAYTLQTGRLAQAHRLIFLCSDKDQLRQQLNDWLDGRSPRHCWSGQIDTAERADIEVPAIVDQTSLQPLAEAWVMGGKLDWAEFNRQHRGDARRVHAPVYPFVRQNFWIAPAHRGAAGGEAQVGPGITERNLHPFLARNTSDLQRQRFSSVFDGEAFFLKQHVVGGQRIFPGVAHLEMARAAVVMATAGRQPSFSQVVWLRPLIIGAQPRQVDIELTLEDDEQIRFEISSRELDLLTGQAKGEPLLHSQGLAGFAETSAPQQVDLAALKARMTGGQLSAKQCYDAYQAMTFEHGPAYQGLQAVDLGRGEVLAQLLLPACQRDSLEDYVLHPSLMDSALQAAIALSLGAEVVLSEDERQHLPPLTRPTLPFGLESLQILDRCSESMWARVSYAERRDDQQTDSGLQRLNIELFDQQGKLCVLMQGFTSRVLGNPTEPATSDQPLMETLLFQPQWIDEVPPLAQAPNFSQRLILLSGFDSTITAEVQQLAAGCCTVLDVPEQDCAVDYQQTALALLQQIRLLLGAGGGRRLLQLAVHNPNDDRIIGGLAAMLRSLQLEVPDVTGQVIELDEQQSLVQRLADNAAAGDVGIRYQAGRRQVQHWRPCPAVDLAIDAPWKDRGVYLITGGLGGLGRLFAQAIAASVSDATLILTGRSALAPHLLAGIDPGRNQIEYRQLDVSDAEAVQRLIDGIVAGHHGLNGVLHSAGVIRDSLLINKQDDELKQVMAAKVAGTRNLDLATAGLALDFWICFSSGTGVVGNAGQADYAAANAFVDRYAVYRNQLTAQGLRRGQSLAINWPLWKEGGMQVDEATAQQMAHSTGMVAMPSNAGIHALRQCVALALPQVLVMHGRREPITALVSGATHVSMPQPAPQVAPNSDAPLTEALHRALIELVSTQMKIPAGEIRLDVEFSQYGFDSISLTTLANTLKQQWRLNLAPTIFFEHATVGRFAAYLEREHRSALDARLAPQIAAPIVLPRQQQPQAATAPRSLPTASVALAKPSATEVDDDIAVIGVSGRFPMADDVEQFFHNLNDGRDCISEIPANRWDWRQYYGDPHREVDKTNVKWGGFIHGVDHFDPLFFAISPREAQLMDPQQRLLMTYVWLAIEDAGYATADLAGSDTGIFVGTGVTGYSSLIAKAGVPVEGYSATAMVPSVGPNRMSFLLDFHGPSEPVETACSSSLVAIHRAVQAMRSGDCRMAVVGGVNTLIAPEAQISFSKAGMLALDGRSKTFSAQANGYARGEGVGMIVLKKRVQAEADGDHIYALIRSTAENHGGKANSLTAPNPRAQAELLKSAWRKAGVDPRSVGYIEAHGTGTELGDPIEINGLKMAFRELAEELSSDAPGQGYCGVGSVKSNIGHLELAAGIAGVIKVLLQLKHKTLFKSLHCEQLNPYIELDDSPFYVVQQSRPWAALKDRHGHELPRRAGVSSFGFGGANAHILLEEYCAPQQARNEATSGVRAFLLSAKNPERLRESARRLADFIATAPAQDPRYLDDLAYTLQVGRDVMQERVALLSDSLGDLQRQLGDFAATGKALYRGTSEGDNPALALFRQDEDMAAALAAWIDKRKYHKLLELWAQGLTIDWRQFYRDARPMRRLSLPGYPFAEERYWVTDLASGQVASPVQGGMWLHPMLERNTSDFYQQRFSSRWQGDESWFADHQVDSRNTMPGVGYLEMARAAIARSLDAQVLDAGSLQLKNIVWLTPYTPTTQNNELHIELTLEQQKVDFRIYSQADGVVLEHCKGSAQVIPAGHVQPLDLDTLCAAPWQRSLEAAALYPLFEAMGIHYGPGHRGVSRLWLGEGRVLARLELAPGLFDGDWVLHPGMLDSAVQASIGLLQNRDGTGETLLPFALEQLNVFGRCQPQMWALISVDGRNAGSAVQRIDIDLCDEHGQIAVALRGFSSRPIRTGRERPTDQLLPAGLSLLAPQWVIADSPSMSAKALPTLAIGASSERHDWLAGLHPQIEFLPSPSSTIDGIAAQLSACAPFQRLIWLAPAKHSTLMLFRMIKALLQLGLAQQALHLQLIFTASIALRPDEPLVPEQGACHGLAGSLAKEQEQWRVELIDLPADGQPLPQTMPEPTLPAECLAWRQGEWFRQRLLPLTEGAPTDAGAVHYREGGVYVVIGGAGGIGEVWTRHLISHWRAQVVWLGRRVADDQINQKLATLAQFARQHNAAAPLYLQADATDAGPLTRARQQVVETCGPINGWVHSALVLGDARLAQMDEAQFSAVFDAKRLTSLAMAQVCTAADNPVLDFVLFFSSMIAFSRAAGQGNYAAGCAFADAFAAQLGQHGPCPVKVINWGYWGSVGVVADAGYRARMAAQGLGSIEPQEGMAALDRLLASPLPQLGLIKLLEPMAIAGIDSGWQLDCYPAQESLASDDWAQVVRHCAPAPQHHPAANEMNRLLLAQTFACLGELAAGGPLTEQRIAAEPAVAANLQAHPFYRRWLRESLRLLTENADIDAHGQLLSALPEPATLWSQWQQASEQWRRDADLHAQLQLVQTCARALPAILRGEQPATGVMFPDGSMALVEGIYKNNRVCDYFNAVLGEVVADVARRQAQSGRPLRILEIGAGTGGTTAGLIDTLRPWQQGIGEYCYTDVSQAFLRHAETHFAPQAPYLRTAIFDVGQPCAEQGISLQHYDLMIATNVLHATPDLRRTLQNAKTALRQGGLLLLNEISDRSMFTHLTFGLLEGWWLHNDTPLRIPGCPGLYPERWRQLLQAQGFDSIAFPASASHSLGQQIVVAASDGVVCLPAQGGAVVANVEPQAPRPVAKADIDEEVLAGQCRQLITEVLSKLVNMAPERLQRDTAFDRYGIDSILQISLIQALEKSTGELSRTILFEHNTINQLTNYLLAEHRPALTSYFAPVQQVERSVAVQSVAPLAVSRHAPVRPAPQPSTSVEAQAANRDIAIIGVNGRYPMAADLDAFWDNLRNGRNCVSEADGQRWSMASNGDERYYGGFLEQVEAFDHCLFGIGDADVQHVSPELRQMLEVAWLTFESAGYNRDALARFQQGDTAAVGVFIGSMYNPSPLRESDPAHAAITANVTDWQIPNRISHCFDLKGPSLAVNTACASSMSAIHLACQSILMDDCAMAMAGGVNLILDPSRYQTLKLASFLGSSDLSRGFGQSDGMLPGEGAGAVLLKPLAAAVADGDRIYGVIKSSSVNHGGGKLMYSAPNTRQQTRLIAETIKRAGLQPAQINYVEAAANGSELGDPIEVAALKKVFGELPPGSCALGTVKSNIGHLEAASGISQLTKVLLQLQHQQLAPSINAEPLNPHIRLEGSAFYLQQHASPWTADGYGQPRRCLINSFGAGGTYASLVVEEYQESRATFRNTGGEQLLIVAAASRGSLLAYLKKLQTLIDANSTFDLSDLAYSLALREHRLAHRAALVVGDKQQLRARLQLLLAGTPDSGCWLSPVDGIEEGEPGTASGSLMQRGEAWSRGAGLDIPALYPSGGNRMALPGYEFEHPLASPKSGRTPPALFSSELYRRISCGELDAAQFERLLTTSSNEQGTL